MSYNSNLKQVYIKQKIKGFVLKFRHEVYDLKPVLDSLDATANNIQLVSYGDKQYDGTHLNPNAFSKQFLRNQLQQVMQAAQQLFEGDRQVLKQQLNKVSVFRDLHEGFFSHKLGIQMCQLATISGGFIEKSTLQADFIGFINAPPHKAKGVLEYVLWKYLVHS